MCAALGPVMAPESGSLGGNHRTLGPPALLYPPPLLTHCSGPARSTSKTCISRTRVGRGLQAARWCWPQTQPRQPHPLGVLGPRPSSTSPAPETAGSLSPSSLWRKPAPPHLTQARRAPDKSAPARPFLSFPGAPLAQALGGTCNGGKAPPAAPPFSPLHLNLLLGCSRADYFLGPLCPLPAMVAWHSEFLIRLAFSLATLVQRGKASRVCAGTTPSGARRVGAGQLACPVMRTSCRVLVPWVCGDSWREVGRSASPEPTGG